MKADGTDDQERLQALLDALNLVVAGKSSQRLEGEFADPVMEQIRQRVDTILTRYDRLATRVDEFNRTQVGLNLGVAECVKALSEVQEGNLHARASDAVLKSDHKLTAMLSAALNNALDGIQRQFSTITSQRLMIEELSTPILEIWDDVLVLPVIGVVDTRRAVEIMERLLAEIVNRRARFVILDITGVEVVDTKTADHFIKLLKAAELLGAQCMVTGIRPAVARTLVDIGVDLSKVRTLRNLRSALRECLMQMDATRLAAARAKGVQASGTRGTGLPHG